ncbi:crossover junction endonuclease EME1 [Echinococcus multilocularis]|uniref:Crossover junction endonuclease EME1 n=1 Tax=Echinococcus multilocularis TaxID=6211 RepID=A0A087VYD2_ECHMU|nr:crossover junction endonuclease EME1 [Echinococcus multilocularis]
MPKVTSRKRKSDVLLSEKYCRRLVSCSFDENFLQEPQGFLAAVSARINCENLNNGKSTCAKLPDWVANPPALIRPVPPKSRGFDGPVPLPFSITWQRYTPSNGPDDSVQLMSVEEPDVLVIVLQNQLRSLLENESKVSEFCATLRSLPQRRRVSVIIFAPRLSSTKDRSFLDLLTRLQFECNLTGVQQSSTTQNLAVLVGNYTKAVCQRPFKKSRLDNRHGFSFLPVSATTVAGAVAAPRFPLTTTCRGNGFKEADVVRAWVHQTWLRQLATWRGMAGEVVHAVAEAYPTPRALFNALNESSGGDSGGDSTVAGLAELPIRRGAGVLATETRLRNAIAARIAAFFTSTDPDLLVDGAP